MLATSGVYGGVRPNYYPWNTFLFWYALCFFIFFFPFLVTSLYYAYHDVSCVRIKPPFRTRIRVSIRQWFQADSYIMLAFIIFFFIIGIMACLYPELQCLYGMWEFLHVLYFLFRLSWLIVLAIMFWRGFSYFGTCRLPVARYIWALLIIGFIYLPFQLLIAFLYPRPVPYPVAVPVGGIAGPIATPYYKPASAILV